MFITLYKNYDTRVFIKIPAIITLQVCDILYSIVSPHKCDDLYSVTHTLCQVFIVYLFIFTTFTSNNAAVYFSVDPS